MLCAFSVKNPSLRPIMTSSCAINADVATISYVIRYIYFKLHNFSSIVISNAVIYFQPQVSKEETRSDSNWMCKRCMDNQTRNRESGEIKKCMVKVNIRKVCSGRDQPQPPPDDMTKLPYDVSIYRRQ